MKLVKMLLCQENKELLVRGWGGEGEGEKEIVGFKGNVGL